jgi:hypothetical protein
LSNECPPGAEGGKNCFGAVPGSGDAQFPSLWDSAVQERSAPARSQGLRMAASYLRGRFPAERYCTIALLQLLQQTSLMIKKTGEGHDAQFSCSNICLSRQL